jgi:hypothetical protein
MTIGAIRGGEAEAVWFETRKVGGRTRKKNKTFFFMRGGLHATRLFIFSRIKLLASRW